MPNTLPEIANLTRDFIQNIVAATEAALVERVQAAVAGALGGAVKRGPGRPKQVGPVVAPALRRSRPKQLCPVPGCTNVAAPIFGMVCAKHKDLSKAKVRQYRDQRMAQAAKAPAAAAPVKRVIRVTAKRRKALKLQGQYLGALKSLPAAAQVKLKAVAKAEGVAEAVRLAGSWKGRKT
jgi:hypothetical protein